MHSAAGRGPPIGGRIVHGEEDAIQALVRAGETSDSQVREAVAEALAKIRGSSHGLESVIDREKTRMQPRREGACSPGGEYNGICVAPAEKAEKDAKRICERDRRACLSRNGSISGRELVDQHPP